MISSLKHHLDDWTIQRRIVARIIVSLIPASCPFARTIRLGRWTILRIPPLCKVNPLYEEMISLRFRASCLLAS